MVYYEKSNIKKLEQFNEQFHPSVITMISFAHAVASVPSSFSFAGVVESQSQTAGHFIWKHFSMDPSVITDCTVIAPNQ